MTAYEESMAALVARVEALESRAHGVMDRLREFDGYVERLEELEAKAVAEIEPVKLTRLTMSNLSESVNALVKACGELWDSKVLNVDSAGDRYVMDSALQKMKRCLKPFEAQR